VAEGLVGKQSFGGVGQGPPLAQVLYFERCAECRHVIIGNQVVPMTTSSVAQVNTAFSEVDQSPPPDGVAGGVVALVMSTTTLAMST
jgi:hypothetical protein